MAVNTDTKECGLIWKKLMCEECTYVDILTKKVTHWTELKWNCSVNIASIVCFFIHSVLISMLPSPAKNLVRLNGVMM